MYLSAEQLTRAVRALDAARSTMALDCPAPRRDAAGQTERALDKPRARRGPSSVTVPYGTHGADYLQIDPETLDLRCGACAGDMDATVKE